MTDPEEKPDSPYDFTSCDDDVDFSTRVIHHGESPLASAFPIYQANTVEGVYVRMKNPTVEALEEKMRVLEGGAAAVATGSGMAAVSHTLLGLLAAGQRMLVHQTAFVGVRTLLRDFIEQLGIEVDSADLNSPAALRQALAKPARLVYFETMSNPALEVIDMPAVIAAAHEAGALVVVDNTLLTPYLLKPLELGVDVVLHSASKYLSGHGDALAGIVTFRDQALAARVHKARRILGGFLSPLAAFLVMRGMKTLNLRVERHCANAQIVAEFLAAHPRVEQVRYPGLAGSTEHALAARFLARFGAMVTLELRGGREWDDFSRRLRVCRVGMSFGDGATRIQREGPIRLSVGLEDPADITRDLAQALDG